MSTSVTTKAVRPYVTSMSESASGEASSGTGASDKDVTTCRECGKEYENRQGVSYHYKTDGNDCTGLECPTCDDNHFLNEEGVRQHHKMAHGESIAGDTVVCAWCGDENTIRPGRVGDSKHHFCDPTCRGKWFSEHRSGENHHQYDRVEVECDWCGETLIRQPSSVNEKYNFCNAEECQAKWLSENNVGEDHPNWKGGKSQIVYGGGWKRQRAKALDRDGHRCVICGATKEDKPNRIDVHHIQHVESFDERSEAHKLSNLVTLCRSHHRKWEGLPVRPDTR